ncbi:MAG TPA: M23 family metallopeptidase [Candidatus Paceibacterota bacterium]
MAQLSLYYPIQPHIVSHVWGTARSAHRSHGARRHNGIDIEITENNEIRSPIDGIVTLSGHHKGSAGVFLTIVSSTPSDFPDGKRAHVELTFLHLSATLVEDGARVSIGTPIARSGSGHVHLAPKRVRKGFFGFRDIDRNDADNTFDPEPYWNGRYA